MDRATLKGKLTAIKERCHDIAVACNKIEFMADGIRFQDGTPDKQEIIEAARKESRLIDVELEAISKAEIQGG